MRDSGARRRLLRLLWRRLGWRWRRLRSDNWGGGGGPAGRWRLLRLLWRRLEWRWRRLWSLGGHRRRGGIGRRRRRLGLLRRRMRWRLLRPRREGQRQGWQQRKRKHDVAM